MSTVQESSEKSEIDRIRREYLRRDQFSVANRYSWAHASTQFAFCETYRACIAELVEANCFPLDGKRIADIGCGSGMWLAEFLQWGAAASDLAGIDLEEHRVEQARRKVPAADLRVGHAGELPWPDASFDMVTQFTLLTSILIPAMRESVAREMLRIVKPGGIILSYDFLFNNPRNPNVRRLDAAEIRALFPGCRLHLRRTELAPPIARRVVGFSWILASVLAKLPFLRTHYVCVIEKPTT